MHSSCTFRCAHLAPFINTSDPLLLSLLLLLLLLLIMPLRLPLPRAVNDNVLPLLSQVVQDYYLYPEFAYAPRARLVGHAVAGGKVVPHVGILAKAVPTTFHLDKLHGACFQRVIWGSGLRLIYNHVLGRLRRESMDLLRAVVMMGYAPPNPFTAHSVSTESAASQSTHGPAAEDAADAREPAQRQRKPARRSAPLRREALNSQLPQMRSSSSAADAAASGGGAAAGRGDEAMEEVVQFTQKALSAIVNADTPTITAAVTTALREIEEEKRAARRRYRSHPSTLEKDAHDAIAASQQLMHSQTGRRLRHHTPKQVPIRQSNRGKAVVPIRTMAADSQLAQPHANLHLQQLRHRNESAYGRYAENAGHRAGDADAHAGTTAAAGAGMAYWSTPWCSSCAFYAPGTCVWPQQIASNAMITDSDAVCFATYTFSEEQTNDISRGSNSNSNSITQRRPLNVVIFSRGSSGNGRTIARETLLRDHLRDKLGARAVICCDFKLVSFEEQLGYAAYADVIIGLHGAGLANLMFAPRGVIVVELKMHYGFGLDLFAVSAEGRVGTLVHLDVRQYDQPGINRAVDIHLINRITHATGIALQRREDVMGRLREAHISKPQHAHAIHSVQHIPGGLAGDLFVFPTPSSLDYAIQPHSRDIAYGGAALADSEFHILGPVGQQPSMQAACAALPLQKYWVALKSDTKKYCLPCGE